MEKGRQQRKRHILGGPLSEVEVETLQEMASHHRHANFRRRALGVLALNDGRSGPAISGVLRVSVPQLYNWALAWRERGLMGMLSGQVGGAPRKLTAPLLQTAVQIACDDSLTLAKIAQRVKEQHPDAPSFSLSRLSLEGFKPRLMLDRAAVLAGQLTALGLGVILTKTARHLLVPKIGIEPGQR